MHHFEAMKSSNVHFTFFRMGKILEGLLAGSVEAEVPHGVECLRDAKHIWERFGGVIDQLQHGTFNSVLHAVEDLGHIIHDIANELEECKATTGTDLDKLREMSQAFTDPWYFIFHVEHDLIVNGQDVHHEIMDAQAQWENQHFYEFGHSVGLSLSKIFLSGSMKNDIPAHYLPAHHERTYGHEDTIYEHTRHHAEPALYDHSYRHGTTGHHYVADEVAAHHDTTPYEHEVAHGHEDTHHETAHHETALHETAHVGDFHAEPVHHREHEYVHEEYHHEEPHHYVEHVEARHEYHHDEPRVVHEHPVHVEHPHYEHPHHEEFHQEEPHVEFEHEAHAGPVHHEYTTVVPHHVEHEMSHEREHHYSPELSHSYYGEHETAHHETRHHEREYSHHEPEHYYTEASHHYYQ